MSTYEFDRDCQYRLTEVGSVDAATPRDAAQDVVDAYLRDDALNAIATAWPPNSGELVVESLESLDAVRYDWYSDGETVDVWRQRDGRYDLPIQY